MPNNIDNIENLDDKTIELGKALYNLKCALDIYKIIGINTTKIKAIGSGQSFFWQVQQLSLDFYVLGICKVFEENKKHKLNSLLAVLRVAEVCNPRDESPLRDFVDKYRTSCEQKEENRLNSAIAELRDIYTHYYREHFKKDGRLKIVRDKMLAHSEDMSDGVKPKNLPSYDLMERLLFFAVDMHSAICRAYLSVHPHLIKDDKKVFSSTRTVLEKFGVSNVKTKFEDE